MADADREREYDEIRRTSQLLLAAADRARAAFAEAAAPHGFSVQVARALLVLAEPRPMRDMAGLLDLDPSSVTGLADQLEERGLIRRVPGADRRVKLLEVTPEGRALRDRLAASVAEAALVSRLDADERATLAALLARLVA